MAKVLHETRCEPRLQPIGVIKHVPYETRTTYIMLSYVRTFSVDVEKQEYAWEMYY